jgi:hypothetical protein
MVRVALILLLIAGCALQTARLANEKAAHADTRRTHAEAIAKAEAATRAEERRKTAAVQEIANETARRLEVARADADAAATAGRRLRDAIATLRLNCAATAGRGDAAGAAADLLADVQRRLDEAADSIAGFADRAHAAGIGCERAYKAVTR